MSAHTGALSFIIINMEQRKETLISERLVLKSITENDKNGLLKIVENPLVKKSYMLPDFVEQKERDNFFEKLKKLSYQKERFVYGIYSKNKIIGFLNEVSLENEEIEVGYFIAPNEWNKGYATEALKTAISALFEMGYKRVIAGHFEDNPASGRVMQKAGMKKIDKIEMINYRHAEHRCLFYQIER